MLRNNFFTISLASLLVVCVLGFFSCNKLAKQKPDPLAEIYSFDKRDSIYSVLISDSILTLSQIDTLKSYIHNVPNEKWDETQTYGQILDNARKTEKKKVELSSYIEVTLKKKFPKRYMDGIFLDFMVVVKNLSEKEIVKFDATLVFYDNYNEKIITYTNTINCRVQPSKNKEFWGAFEYVTKNPLSGSVTNRNVVSLEKMRIADVTIKPIVTKVYFADNTIQSIY